MKNLTPRQNEILNFIRQTIREQQVAPTLTEIADVGHRGQILSLVTIQ